MIRRVEGRLRAAGTAGSGDDGFTIVEAVVSMVLLIVLSTAVLAAVLSSIRLAEQVRSRTVATELATREVAQTRALLDAGSISVDDLIAGTATANPTPLDGGVVSEDLQVGPTSFTVARTVSLASSAEGQSLCTSGATALTGTDDLMVRIEVSVTWSGRGSYSPVRLVELAGMPDGLSVGTGALVVVRVVDPTHGGAGVVGATVELRSNNWYHSVAAGTTDQDGCAIARVPSTSLAGSSTYTAVATKPGYVSQSWTATTASTIGKPGYGSHVLVNRVTLGYAPSATLRVHITTEDGTAAASDQEVSGSDLTVLCSSSGTAASAPGWTATLSGAVLEIPAVWPCTYSAYLGDEVPATMTQVQVDGSVSDVVDIWVRPGYGIVSDPTGLVVPSPAPSTAEPTPAPSPTPTPTSSPETEEEQPAPEPSASATAGVS